MADFDQTPNYQLYKPTFDADDDQWGQHLNTNADTLDSVVGGMLPLAGGSMTGDLVLSRDPQVSLGAATRQYVDNLVSRSGGPWLPLSGGTVTGNINVSATLDATTIQSYNNRAQTGGILNTALGIYGDLSGVKTGGNNSFTRIALTSDTLAAGGGGIMAFMIDQHSGGTGTTGNRVGAFINFNFAGGTTNKSLGVGSMYGGMWSYATATGNVGGATGSGNAYGSLWGGITSAALASGATFWASCIGHEVNVGVGVGASAAYVQGLKIVLSNHTQAASPITDFLLGIAKLNAADVGIANGVTFGSADGYWPIDASGTLIGTQASLRPTPPPMTAIYGVDFNAVTFSGFAFRSSGFSVSGTGAVIGSSGSFTTLAVSSTVSGAGFTTYLASPPAIGGTVAAAGAFTTLSTSGMLSANSGLNFGIQTAASATDFTKHIALSGSTAGISVTASSTTNYVASGGGAHNFYVGSTSYGYISNLGLNACAVGQQSAAAGSFTTLSASGGTLSLTNGTSNLISYGAVGFGAPTFTTRSAGTKIVIYPNIGATTADYAIGLEAGYLWMGFQDATSANAGFRWYGGTTRVMQLATNTGSLSLLGGFGLFNTAAVTTKPTVTGAKGSNAALASLMTALASYGLVTDTTTA